jgi:hypothetical protein
MIRRLIDVLRRGPAEPSPPLPLRPNALSRDAARAERLRREARQAEAATRQLTAAEENRIRRDTHPTSPTHPRPDSLAASLQSRSELRRALLLREILAPPAALRRPRDGNPGA